MNSILEFMSKDHDKLDKIFEKFREVRVKNINKAKPFFHDFKIDLQKHILWEEEILFPLFENKIEMNNIGPTAVMRTEHRQIKEFLEKIHEKVITRALEGVGELENDLLEVLKNHDEKEENILYPWIDDSLSEEEREEALRKMKNLPPEKYNKCCE